MQGQGSNRARGFCGLPWTPGDCERLSRGRRAALLRSPGGIVSLTPGYPLCAIAAFVGLLRRRTSFCGTALDMAGPVGPRRGCAQCL